MTEIEQARAAYSQLATQPTSAAPLTLLHLGAQQTLVVSEESALVLALGFAKTAAFFRHLPPTPEEMELAIMAVEDEVTRIRHQVNTQHALHLHDAQSIALAEASGVTADTQGWNLSQDDIERLFKRVEQVMLGRPAHWEGIPLDNAFMARLLILREFMHHLGFMSVQITNPPMMA